MKWKKKNTSLAAPGALANHLQRRTARKANEANLNPAAARANVGFTSTKSSNWGGKLGPNFGDKGENIRSPVYFIRAYRVDYGLKVSFYGLNTTLVLSKIRS